MRVPLEWLKEYVPVEESAEEIAARLTMGGLEVEGIETSEIGPVLDVYITPNRGDCLSMIGVAREVAALYDLPLTVPAPPPSGEGGETARQTSVAVQNPDLCPRYAARIVRDIKIGPSPAWMQARLEAAGQRPISNLVDVTNYTMLELGQPLHAFDLDKLGEQRIVVRRARESEAITTLDGAERALTPNILVIADANKPVAVAGVMGGADSEVGDDTKNVLLESAHFNPLSIRRASRALELRTEASYRFERVVDPEGVRRAVDRACELLAAMGQPKAVEGVVDVYPEPYAAKTISVRVLRASDVLGMEISSHSAADCLRRLGLEVLTEPHGDTDTLKVTVPPSRPDLNIEEDLIEEIGRIYGYENIPETLPVGDTTLGGDSEDGRFLLKVKQILSGCGLQEVVTHSLTAPSFFDSPDDAVRRVPVRNALSTELSGLRRSLIPTLLDTAQLNAARGQQSLAIFEIGRIWQNEDAAGGESQATEHLAVAGLLVGPMIPSGWQRDARPAPADFSSIRGVVERLCAGLAIPEISFRPLEIETSLPGFHPGRTALLSLTGERTEGVLGELHPRLAAGLEMRSRVYLFEVHLATLKQASRQEFHPFRSLPKFPSVVRDVAPRLSASIPYAQVEQAVRAVDEPLLEEVKLTDVFAGAPLPEGTRSLTLSFTFRSAQRTLTDADINEALGRIRTALEARCGATFAA